MYRHMIAEVSEQRLVTVSDHSPQELMRDAFNIANGLISNGKVQFEKDARTKEGGGSQIIFPTPDSDFQDKVLVLPVLALDVAGLCRLPEASALISAGLALKMLDSLIVHNTSKLIVARIDKKIEGKDLYEVMTEDEEINNNLNRLIVIGRAFLIALQDFQAHHLIHRDIKLENI
ncbi:MAG: hypothetical protein NTV32_01805, partial [Gammaproteobacteria bacterium]|nr:hypothetical protein [Gammaproteobacteria bacterium]